MKSLVLLTPVGQMPDHHPSGVMAVGAALVLLLALGVAVRTLQPLHGLLKAAAGLGLALFLITAAFVLVVISLVA